MPYFPADGGNAGAGAEEAAEAPVEEDEFDLSDIMNVSEALRCCRCTAAAATMAVGAAVLLLRQLCVGLLATALVVPRLAACIGPLQRMCPYPVLPAFLLTRPQEEVEGDLSKVASASATGGTKDEL